MEYPREYWENIRANKVSGPGPDDWPDHVQAISQNGLGLLGIDSEGRLYWDGKRLPTITLTRWQKIGAVMLAASAAIAALAATASAIAEWKALAKSAAAPSAEQR